MKIDDMKYVLQFVVEMRLRTALLLRTGKGDEFADNTIEVTPDLQSEIGDNGIPKLHINGYVWAGLLRRSLGRLKSGTKMVEAIGKYPKDLSRGVSPLWCESTFAALTKTDTNPGNKIDRKYGATSIGGLFNEEIVPIGMPFYLHFNYYYADEKDGSNIKETLLAALWVIDEGVENIGGGWSYGHGRLEVTGVKHKVLTLGSAEDRKKLWHFDAMNENTILDWQKKKKAYRDKNPEIENPWMKYSIEASIPEGQLLAIHTNTPPLELSDYDKLPDTYVFTRTIIGENKSAPEQIPVVTGKAFRQAIISSAIERKLRTKKEAICLDTTTSKNCACKRCLWFGATDRGGILSVGDAIVSKAERTILNRIQLCEHTMQNMNLFAEEYLTKGQFNFEIIIDCSKDDSKVGELIKELDCLLNEMKCPIDNEEIIAPPGWYRLGATSTCTGQIAISACVRTVYSEGSINGTG